MKTKLRCRGGAWRASSAISVITAVLSLAVGATPIRAASRPSCEFVGGFNALHSLDSGDVGDCVNNQSYVVNGDAQQMTTRGMLVWRKADNWTAFTDGYHTWINGPSGLVRRLNSERFAWESQTGADDPSGMTADFFGLLNADRQQSGLPPLTLNPALTTVAQSRTQDILGAGGALNHYAADGSLVVRNKLGGNGTGYRALGENLAEDFNRADQSVRSANGALMDSPPHRANILNPEYTQAGVAIASRGPSGPFFYVQVFADPAG